ncbi:hypothetical protein [Staphylococcus hominis]|uniref:hypothetical protein n=1 Tax=Staphylococcus hominis TaxID=1290 RepID=UPI001F585EAF|nr:hypothetical protein [Staphylococcus hominis]MCI2877152.1 hypothetical protein [Staphylococcus hominis]
MIIYRQILFDTSRFLTSIWTYIGIFIIFLNSTIFILNLNAFNTISTDKIFRIVAWFVVFLGMLIIIRTISRDVQYKTLQSIFNNDVKRKQYYFSKILSTIVIILFSYLLIIIYSFTLSLLMGVFSLSLKTIISSFIIIFLFLFIYSLLLYGITLLIQVTLITYILGILSVLFLPMSFVFIQMIPNLGNKLIIISNFIPFIFLTNKVYNGDFTFTFSQIIISIIVILALLFLNLRISRKVSI